MTRSLEPGMLVGIAFDPNSQMPNMAAKEHNGTIWRISRKLKWGTHGHCYELEGLTSKKGIPYTFTEDDLYIVEAN